MATIKEIKAELSRITDLSDERLAELSRDSRAGVASALKARQKQLTADRGEDIRLDKMLRFERNLYVAGATAIAGIDEVGRGPLAGPVVAAAVILPKNCKIRGLNDSKQVPKKRHVALYEEIVSQAVAVGVGRVEPATIDRVNIYQATKLAMMSAVAQLAVEPDHLLIDAMRLDLPIAQTRIVKGDASSLSIAAASIVAKVTRDRLMQDYDKLYPQYDFAHNVGYGTKKHLEALQKYGITPIHRQTFEPIKSMLA